jgi:hypothetical protein
VTPRGIDEARAKAESRVGEEAVAAAEKDRAFDDQLELHLDLMDESTAEYLPVIIHRNVVVSERIESASELRGILEREFQIRPEGSTDR